MLEFKLRRGSEVEWICPRLASGRCFVALGLDELTSVTHSTAEWRVDGFLCFGLTEVVKLTVRVRSLYFFHYY